MLWILPVAVALILALPVLFALRRVAREADGLRRSLTELAALRDPLVELRTDVLSLQAGVPALAVRTRPRAPAAS